MDEGKIGYNKGEIEDLRDTINSAAQSCGENIIDILENNIIGPISKAWYAPEAVYFFEGFAEWVSKIGGTAGGEEGGTGITGAFDSFRAAVQAAGENWAENVSTGEYVAEKPVLAEIDQVELTLDVSKVQADDAGTIYIHATDASNVASSLAEVEQSIKASMAEVASDLNADSAFIGGNQSVAIENCFTKVAESVHEAFKYLTEGDNNLQSQINKAIQKYGDVSKGISSSFGSN